MKMTTAKQLMNTHAPASAQTADNGWKRKLLPGALAAALLAFGCTSANAIEFSKDEWSGSFDTTISYGAIWRAGDLKEDYVGKAYFNPSSLLRTTPRSVRRRVAGQSIAMTATATTRKVVTWWPTPSSSHPSWMCAIRTMVLSPVLWVSTILRITTRTFFPMKPSTRVGKDIRLLDLYVWGENEVGDRFLNWRLGRQVVSWGESTFIQGGINVINPVDVSRLRVAGAELKEAFEGVNMLWGSIDLTPTCHWKPCTCSNTGKSFLILPVLISPPMTLEHRVVPMSCWVSVHRINR